MKQFIRDYLTFNKRERNGLFVLLSIIAVLIIYLNVSEQFITAPKVDFTKFESEIKQFNSSVQHINDSIKNENENRLKERALETLANSASKPAEYFNFNPNNLSDSDWQRLGFSEKQIKTIKNYESKGGKFRSKEDVKKMYCIPEKQYLSLEPYISIPETASHYRDFAAEKKLKAETPKPKPETIIVELNSADSAQLTKVKGIGPFYAKSIVKYRNLLGGFTAKEQLMEMWKFDSTKFAGIENYIIIDPTAVKKININTCTAAELKHPYISWNMANAIVNYRSKHGKYKSIEDIKKTDLVDDKTYRKIVPYLTLQ